jgi:response regulator NasT
MSSESGSVGTGPLRVLVAEDQAIIRLDLRGVLEQHGLIVCAEARDGEEAVELARSAHPDVALLDMRMPELDGIEAARRMYAERPIPIVMLTAFSDRAVSRRRSPQACSRIS